MIQLEWISKSWFLLGKKKKDLSQLGGDGKEREGRFENQVGEDDGCFVLRYSLSKNRVNCIGILVVG